MIKAVLLTLLTISCLLVITLSALTASAFTIRYAIIVGNNNGVDSYGNEPFAPLKHAQKEAKRLRKELVRLSNFDASENRTVLLLNTTKKELSKALKRIILQINKDKAALGKINTLFFFYFTGHGLKGKLLFNDGPMDAHELGQLFKIIKTDFSISVFDTCYSGSLDMELLAEKGIKPAPGLNLFREMPEEILTAEGSMWFVSSGPEQASYEDENLGGIFTYFFIEALEKAEKDGPGITLNTIWQYARKKTVSFTSAYNRKQEPEQYIAKLKIKSPLYFSFPESRNSTLVLLKSVKGKFILSYADGQLTEILQKVEGEIKEVAVYSGKVRLLMLKGNEIFANKELNLLPESRLVFHGEPDPAPKAKLGHKSIKLWEKGAEKTSLTATAVQPGKTFIFGTGCQLGFANENSTLPKYSAWLNSRIDISRIIASIGFNYGGTNQEYETWGVKINTFGGEAGLGYGWDLSGFRLGVKANLGLSRVFKKYENGFKRSSWSLLTAADFSFLYLISQNLQIELFIKTGVSSTPQVKNLNSNILKNWTSTGLSVYFLTF